MIRCSRSASVCRVRCSATRPDALCSNADRVRGELGAVVGYDHLRLAAALDQGRELACHPSARDRRVGNRCQALPGHVIDDIEDAKAAAARELVVDEIERPTGIRLRINQDRSTSSHCLAATSAFAHGQALLAIEPVDAIDAGWLALVPQ